MSDKFALIATEPGLSNVKHTVSVHDTPQEARDAYVDRCAADIDSGDVVTPSYAVRRVTE